MAIQTRAPSNVPITGYCISACVCARDSMCACDVNVFMVCVCVCVCVDM